MKLGKFVKKRRELFWSTKNYDDLSEAVVVEAILNYGDMDDVRELIKLLGIQKVAKIFYKNTTNRARVNYDKRVIHYFNLYFKKNA